MNGMSLYSDNCCRFMYLNLIQNSAVLYAYLNLLYVGVLRLSAQQESSWSQQTGTVRVIRVRVDSSTLVYNTTDKLTIFYL